MILMNIQTLGKVKELQSPQPGTQNLLLHVTGMKDCGTVLIEHTNSNNGPVYYRNTIYQLRHINNPL